MTGGPLLIKITNTVTNSQETQDEERHNIDLRRQRLHFNNKVIRQPPSTKAHKQWRIKGTGVRLGEHVFISSWVEGVTLALILHWGWTTFLMFRAKWKNKSPPVCSKSSRYATAHKTEDALTTRLSNPYCSSRIVEESQTQSRGKYYRFTDDSWTRPDQFPFKQARDTG